MQDPVSILSKLPKDQRSSAWEAIGAARDPATLERVLRGLSLSDEDRAELWETRAAQLTSRPPIPEKPEAPGLARQAMTAVADTAVGALKGAGNTFTGLGNLAYKYVPPVRVMSDLAQRVVYGDVQPAQGLFDQARSSVQPANTAEKVGYGAEQLTEFFALPSGAGSLVAKAATQAVGNAGLSLVQGTTSAGAGISGAVGALSPVVNKAVASLGPALKQGAERGVERALGATKERFKAMASKLAPEFLRRDVGGVLGKSREAILKEASENAGRAGQAIDDVLARSGGNVVKTAPVISALEDAKSAYQTTRTLTAGELAAAPDLAKRARQLSSGDFEIDVVLDSRPIRQLSKLQQVITNLGPNATVDQVVATRRAWDTVVAQAGGYAQRAPGAIGVSLKEESEAWAKRKATTAIREVLASAEPTLAKVNKEYAFWKSLEDVVDQTLKRTAPQKGGLGKTIMTVGGMAVGASSGDGVVDRTEKALIAGALANRLDLVLKSSRWTLASANVKNSLAEAIASGSAERVNAALSKVLAWAPPRSVQSAAR